MNLILYFKFLIKNLIEQYQNCLFNYIKSNNLYLNLKFKNKGKIYVCNDFNVSLKRNSCIIVENGILKFNSDVKHYEKGTFNLLLGNNAILISENSFQFNKSGHILIDDNAILKLGSGYINRNCRIKCYNSIQIGENVAISENFTIWDDDVHIFNNNQIKNKGVIIGNFVWIGNNVTILKNVTIGDNVVIASNSLINKDVPSNSLVGGIPAKIIQNNISWKE